MNEIIVGYLRVLLSAPPMTVLVVIVLVRVFKNELKTLMDRIATIKFLGGELSTTFQVIDHTEKTGPDEPTPDLPEDLNNISLEQQERVRNFIQAQQDTIKLWEYRYLREYLVLSTHQVLAWLNLQNSTSIDLFDALWAHVIPIAKSRENIILALQNHYLITVRDEVMIEITDKGRDYLQWRGDSGFWST